MSGASARISQQFELLQRRNIQLIILFGESNTQCVEFMCRKFVTNIANQFNYNLLL